MSRMAAGSVRAKAHGTSTPQRSPGPRPCALVDKGCTNNRTKHSIFCYAHGRRIEEWAKKSEAKRKARLQDLDRWRSFHDYSGKEGD